MIPIAAQPGAWVQEVEMKMSHLARLWRTPFLCGAIASHMACVEETKNAPRVGVVESTIVASPVDAEPAYGDFDGDGCVDIGLKSDAGAWYIDLCANGYGSAWDAILGGYGDDSAHAVPADYDGDGKTDLAVKDDDTGRWAIDYARNGYGGLEVEYFGYGFVDAIPVPADYDGDGRADLSIKDSAGMWAIDFALGGFGTWNDQRWGYHGADWVPVPANYDGDVHSTFGKPIADRAVKSTAGEWMIDNSSNGYGKPGTTAIWDLVLRDYGPASAVPVPGDYDNDGFADLAIKDAFIWKVDYYRDSYDGWDVEDAVSGGSTTRGVVGHFFAANSAVDRAVQDLSSGISRLGLVNANSWTESIDNAKRPVLSHPDAPRIFGTRITGPLGTPPIVNGIYQLDIGRKYTISLSIKAGNVTYQAAPEVNPALNMPRSLVINNRFGASGHINIEEDHTRRHSLVCTQPGSFQVGFRMRDNITGNPFNPDSGVKVRCKGPGYHTISGRVTQRTCVPMGSTCDDRDGGNGHYSAGSEAGLVGIPAKITVDCPISSCPLPTIDAAADGTWSSSVPSDTPLRITITKDGFSSVVVNGAEVPDGTDGGLYLDTPMEEEFGSLVHHGMRYTTYLDMTQGHDTVYPPGGTQEIDYVHGRTIFHVVEIDTSLARVETRMSAQDAVLIDTMARLGSRYSVLINGGNFNDVNSSFAPRKPVSYFFSQAEGGDPGSLIPCVFPVESICTAETMPMLTIADGSTRTSQRIQIVQDTAKDFRNNANFTTLPNGSVVWDDDHDGVGDASYALQCGNQAPLYRATPAPGQIAWEQFPEGAATAVGVAGTRVYLVVVDGEGIYGGNGASGEQVGRFFRDVLYAEAMLLDSGASTQMVIRSANGEGRRINQMASEDNLVDSDPYTRSRGGGWVGNVIGGALP